MAAQRGSGMCDRARARFPTVSAALARKHSRKGLPRLGLTGGGRGAQAREAGAELADTLWVVVLVLTGAKGPADGHNQLRYSSPVAITSRRAASAVPRPGALEEYDRPHGWVRSSEWCPRAQLPFLLSC